MSEGKASGEVRNASRSREALESSFAKPGLAPAPVGDVLPPSIPDKESSGFAHCAPQSLPAPYARAFKFPFPDFCRLGGDAAERGACDVTYEKLLDDLAKVQVAEGDGEQAAAAAEADNDVIRNDDQVQLHGGNCSLVLSCRKSYVTESDTISEVRLPGSPVSKVSRFPPEGHQDGDDAGARTIFDFGGKQQRRRRRRSQAAAAAAANDDGGGTVAVPLTIFVDTHTVELGLDVCNRSPFLKMLLAAAEEAERGDPANANAKKGIEIEFPHHKLLRAFVTALQEMKAQILGLALPSSQSASLELDGMNVFEVLSCSALLQTPRLQQICELCMTRTMNAHNFSAAVRYATATRREEMLRTCYHFLKQAGLEEWRERRTGGRGEKRDEKRKVGGREMMAD